MRLAMVVIAVLCCVMSVKAQDDYICGQVVFSGKHETLISAEVATQVIKINKEFGEPFKTGQVILELDSTVPKAEYIQAKAEFSSAQEQLKTLQSLYSKNVIQNRSAAVVKAASENLKTLTSLHKSGSVSDIELANATRDYVVATADHEIVVAGEQKEINAAKLNVAKAMRNMAFTKKNYDSCLIKAPFDGKVEQLFVKHFEQVQASKELAKLVGDKILVGRYLLNEKDYTEVRKGLEVSVQVDVIGQSVKGVISQIDPVIDPASRTFEVWIEVDNSSQLIRPGMMGTIKSMKSEI